MNQMSDQEWFSNYLELHILGADEQNIFNVMLEECDPEVGWG